MDRSRVDLILRVFISWLVFVNCIFIYCSSSATTGLDSLESLESSIVSFTQFTVPNYVEIELKSRTVVTNVTLKGQCQPGHEISSKLEVLDPHFKDLYWSDYYGRFYVLPETSPKQEIITLANFNSLILIEWDEVNQHAIILSNVNYIDPLTFWAVKRSFTNNGYSVTPRKILQNLNS